MAGADYITPAEHASEKAAAQAEPEAKWAEAKRRAAEDGLERELREVSHAPASSSTDALRLAERGRQEAQLPPRPV